MENIIKQVVEVVSSATGLVFQFPDEAGRTTQVQIEFQKRTGIGNKSDILAKACGYKKSEATSTRALDLTAGLCRDAYHLSLLGFQVTALEQNKTIYSVLSAQIKRFDVKIDLQNINAKKYLENLSPDVDVIFYDPMFPDKKKSAKAGKESQLLQMLETSSSPEDEAQILQLARTCATKRVVVKRPLHAPAITKPDVQYKGKSVRFDVYLTKKNK